MADIFRQGLSNKVVFVSTVIKCTKYHLTFFLPSNKLNKKLQKSPKRAQKLNYRQLEK